MHVRREFSVNRSLTRICSTQPQFVTGFVEALTPPYTLIIQKDIADLSIYVMPNYILTYLTCVLKMFQLLALCLELEPAGQIAPIFTAVCRTRQ